MSQSTNTQVASQLDTTRLSTRASVRRRIAVALLNLCDPLITLHREQDALDACSEIDSRFGGATTADLQEIVVLGLTNKAIALNALQRHRESVAVYDDVFNRYGDNPHIVVREAVSKAVFNKAITIADDMGDVETSLSLFEQVVQDYGDVEAIEVRQRVGNALIRKAYALSTLGRNESSVATYDEVVNRYDGQPEMKRQVANAMLNKSFVLSAMNQHQESLLLCEEIVERFGVATDEEVQRLVGNALLNKSAALADLGHEEEKLNICDEIVRRLGEFQEEESQKIVARALFNKALGLVELGRVEEATKVYADIIQNYKQSAMLPIQEVVACAMVDWANILKDDFSKMENALALYEEVVERFGQATEPVLQRQFLFAAVNRSLLLRAMGRTDEALVALAQLSIHTDLMMQLGLDSMVGMTLLNRGVWLLECLDALDDQGARKRQIEQAFACFDHLATQWGSSSHPQVREQVATGLLNKARSCNLEQFDLLIQACDDLLDRFGDAKEVGLRECVAEALLLKGWTLFQMTLRRESDAPDEALVIMDEVIVRFEGDLDPWIQRFAQEAKRRKADMLDSL